jgi:hypothetical protein
MSGGAGLAGDAPHAGQSPAGQVRASPRLRCLFDICHLTAIATANTVGSETAGR